MIGVRKLLGRLADNTAEALDDVYKRLQKLEEDRRDDTVLLLVLYEALYAAVSDPGQPFVSFTKAREILTMLGE